MSFQRMSFSPLPIDHPFSGSHSDYKNRCYTFLIVLCNDKDLNLAAEYLAPDSILIHDDFPPVAGAKNFIQAWGKNLEKMPNYHKDIMAIITEVDDAMNNEGGMKVWVYSRIQGLGEGEGNVRDSIDMMQFTKDGFFLSSKDVQRIIPAGKE